jgi:hypothetical protein
MSFSTNVLTRLANVRIWQLLLLDCIAEGSASGVWAEQASKGQVRVVARATWCHAPVRAGVLDQHVAEGRSG